MSGLVGRVGSLLSRLGLKAPWKVNYFDVEMHSVCGRGHTIFRQEPDTPDGLTFPHAPYLLCTIPICVLISGFRKMILSCIAIIIRECLSSSISLTLFAARPGESPIPLPSHLFTSQVTGPLADAEWKHQDSMASDYRAVPPMDQAVPIIPWSENKNIFDIKYYNRDTRRSGTVGGLLLSQTQVIRKQGAAGADIPGGLDLDDPVPVGLGRMVTSMTQLSDLAPSGYTAEGDATSTK